MNHDIGRVKSCARARLTTRRRSARDATQGQRTRGVAQRHLLRAICRVARTARDPQPMNREGPGITTGSGGVTDLGAQRKRLAKGLLGNVGVFPG